MERLEKIIRSDEEKTRRCTRIKEDTALEITDLSFGAKVIIAEWVPPFSIQIAIRITPPMKDIGDKPLREIYEFLLGLATDDALQIIFQPEEKMCAIAVKFPCVSSFTDMDTSLGNGADELYSFVDMHMEKIKSFLKKRGVRWD
nr:hypothetical protein [Nitrosomonas nitrosa]